MKKILALVMAMAMVLALCACGAKEEAPVAVEAAPEAAPAAVEAAPEAAPAAAEDTFAAWKEYAAAYATAGAPTEEEKTSVAESILACATYEEVTEISVMTVLLENVILPYDAWVEAGMPEADVSNVQAGDPGAGSGEASGEASGEMAA